MAVQLLRTKPEFPEKAMGLFRPAPFKIMHGGRGAAKSWSFVRAQLILAAKRKLFWLHARELQRSIKESVHKLIADQITALQMNYLWEVLDTEIVGANGSRHVFAGIRNNITAIKSYEGLDGASVYEGTHVPRTNWDVFLPTIRRDPPHGPFGQGSEIWIEFNPELATDDTYAMWVANPPDDAIVIEMNYEDNPWFPEFLRKQMERMRRDDYDNYLTVWKGKTRRTVEGAIYAKELQKAIEDGRISPDIQPIRGRGVTITFDLGDQDICSWWAVQQVGTTHNVVDHYSNCGFDIVHYLEEIVRRKILVKRILLPHDAKQRHQAARGLVHNTIEKQVRAVYPGDGQVIIVPAIKPTLRINAMRALFPRVQFNEVACHSGIQSLTHYKFGINTETKQRTQEPLHDWASHDADALGQYAVKVQEGQRPAAQEEDDDIADGVRRVRAAGGALGWMQ